MASSDFSRERHLVSIRTFCLLDGRYDTLSYPGQILHLLVTNLRNRPLSSANIKSLRYSILSLYHNLTTGSQDFPVIQYTGTFCSHEIDTPFEHVEEEPRENAKPLLGPAASSGHCVKD